MRIQDSGLRVQGVIAGLVLTALLAGCSSAPKSGPRVSLPPSTEKPSPPPVTRGGGYYQDDGPGDNPPANLEEIPDAVPRVEPLHRFANDPYIVLGRSYTPDTSGAPYKANGVASWYGRKFHGRRTASGEVYDMYAMTAAHTTLPIPSYVRVTNPRNGKTIVVRVNDRGPFHGNRLIDLSYTAAHKLGLIGVGSGLVELERIDPARWQAPEPVRVATAKPDIASTPATEVASYWLQFGAFGVQTNAEQLLNRMQTQLGSLGDSIRIVAKDGLFRLRAGPFVTVAEANDLAAQVRKIVDIPSVVLR